MRRLRNIFVLFVGFLLAADVAVAGPIVLTGPDQDFHGFRGAGGSAGNQYRLLLNSVQFVSPVAAPRIAGIGASFGTNAANSIPLDLPGATVSRISTAAYDAMTVAQLRASFDVLIFTWASSPAQNNDWTTRLLPFLNLGGGIIYEDDGNLADLLPAVTAFNFNTSGAISVSAVVPGLTDGVVNNLFANNHIGFSAWDPAFSPFLVHSSGNVVGLYATFGEVPEPASIAVWSLLLIAGGCVFWLRRRRVAVC